MPKETFFARYSLIIKRLEKSPATFEEIANYLQLESELQDRNFEISKRTFQRDLKDIDTQLGIVIVNERKGDKKYRIVEKSDNMVHSQRLMESYQVTNAIHASQEYSQYVFLENRQPKGLEHFSGMFYAILNKRIINFTHYKYWDETVTERTVHPLALKESQGRWYLLAVDTKDNRLKTFGLDRMDDLEIIKTTFRNKYSFDLKKMFDNCFGIFSLEDTKPMSIQLSFEYEQGQYVKNYPIHHSQKVGREDDEVIIELYVGITHDFVMELLSFGASMKVLKPKSLVNMVKKAHEEAAIQYSLIPDPSPKEKGENTNT